MLVSQHYPESYVDHLFDRWNCAMKTLGRAPWPVWFGWRTWDSWDESLIIGIRATYQHTAREQERQPEAASLWTPRNHPSWDHDELCAQGITCVSWSIGNALRTWLRNDPLGQVTMYAAADQRRRFSRAGHILLLHMWVTPSIRFHAACRAPVSSLQ